MSCITRGMDNPDVCERLRFLITSNIINNPNPHSFYQPAVGPFPWGPVLDRNFTKPGDSWYHGWKERDWHFLNRTPEELIKHGHFNRGLSYMAGVTSQEAAYIICKFMAAMRNRMLLIYLIHWN